MPQGPAQITAFALGLSLFLAQRVHLPRMHLVFLPNDAGRTNL
jgi:hypothetical protein